MRIFDQQVVIIDTEYTSWPGCIETGWNRAEGQHRECIQLSAMRVSAKKAKCKDAYNRFIRPSVNPELSSYVRDLTGHPQCAVDQADAFPEVMRSFRDWVGSAPVYSWGSDWTVLLENCALNGCDFPKPPTATADIRLLFDRYGVPVDQYSSGTIHEHFGLERKGHVHNALWDVDSIRRSAAALRNVVQDTPLEPAAQ